MDWSNEDYVRMYTRETSDDLMLSWQALALWRAMLCKFDQSGLIDTRRGHRGLAALVRMPPEVVESALAELVEDGRVQSKSIGFFAPNFVEAQTATKSDKQRQRESRDRRAATARDMPDVTNRDADVTKRDEMSRAVTSGHERSQPVTLCSALLSSALPSFALDSASTSSPLQPTPEPTGGSVASGKKTRGPRAKPRTTVPDDWEPRAQEREQAQSMGLDVSYQAQRFRNHHIAKGTLFANHDRAFSNWLDAAPRFANGSHGGGKSPVELQFERVAMLEARDRDRASRGES